MPDTIEASDYGSNGCKERIPHPYGKYRVFLSKGLSGSNLIVESFTDFASKIELKQTGNQRYHKQAYFCSK